MTRPPPQPFYADPEVTLYLGDAAEVLSPTQRAAIHAAVLVLPPLTDEQTDALCAVITNARHRWRRQDTESPPPHP